MSPAERLVEGLEMARCAEANLRNLVESVPGLAMLPMYKVVKLQIEQTIEALEGRTDPNQLHFPIEDDHAPRT
jgi:hypothetical protein